MLAISECAVPSASFSWIFLVDLRTRKEIVDMKDLFCSAGYPCVTEFLKVDWRGFSSYSLAIALHLKIKAAV